MKLSRMCSAALVIYLVATGTIALAQNTNQAMITGTVSYMVRMAIPPGAVVNVSLEDVPPADAPAKVIAAKAIPTEGKQVPIPFELPYDAAAIEASHKYVVRATINVGDQMLFASTAAYPVLTNGAPTRVAIMVQPSRGGRGPATAPATQQAGSQKLLDTQWNIVTIAGVAAAEPEGRKPYITLRAAEKGMGGMAGVNQFFGSYELDGNTLTIKPGGSTMMAGPEPLMQQEQKVFELLGKVDRYAIEGNRLTLFGADKPLLVLEAGQGQ